MRPERRTRTKHKIVHGIAQGRHMGRPRTLIVIVLLICSIRERCLTCRYGLVSGDRGQQLSCRWSGGVWAIPPVLEVIHKNREKICRRTCCCQTGFVRACGGVRRHLCLGLFARRGHQPTPPIRPLACTPSNRRAPCRPSPRSTDWRSSRCVAHQSIAPRRAASAQPLRSTVPVLAHSRLFR